jgi:hypothetical protein
MAENEYKPKENIIEEPVVKQTEKKVKATKTAAPKEKVKLKNPIEGLSTRFDKKKVKSTVGALLILFSFYLFLACFSYIFTWTQDQDRVIDKGLFQFLFEAVILSLIGGLIGMFLVWIIALILSSTLDFEFVLSASNMLLGSGLAAFIGLIAGIIPAISASKLDPVEAIRSGM